MYAEDLPLIQDAVRDFVNDFYEPAHDLQGVIVVGNNGICRFDPYEISDDPVIARQWDYAHIEANYGSDFNAAAFEDRVYHDIANRIREW